MKTPIRFLILSILALIGLGIGIYQTYHFFEVRNGLIGFKTFCTFGKFDCQAIDSSPYAQLLPGFPLAAFVSGWMLSIFTISLVGRSIAWRREALRALVALTSVGLALSAFYAFIMFAVLKVYCLLCLGVDVVNLALFGIVVSLVPGNIKQTPHTKSHWKTFAAIVAGGVVFAFFLALGMGGKGPSMKEINEIVEDKLRSPVLPVTVDDTMPSMGPKNAPIVIVKFSDFQCPACRRGAYTLHPLLKTYGDKVRFVFRNFPLDMSCNRQITSAMHARACEAAHLAWCKSKLGHFEEAYFALFDNQEELASIDLFGLLAKNPADTQSLKTCVDSQEVKDAIQKDIDEAIRLNVTSTPTFFINGHRVEGTLPTEAWRRLFDEILRQKR